MILNKYKNLELIVYEKSPDDNDRHMNPGFVVHKIEARWDDEIIGYLKISYIPDKEMDLCYPDIAHFKKNIEGWHGLDLENRDKMWHQITLRCKYQFPEPKMEDVPEPKQRDKEIDEMLSKYKRSYKNFIYNFQFPFVDYIRVHDGYKLNGLAILLYCTGARWLPQVGKNFLRQSTCQTPEAKLMWKYLRKNKLASEFIYVHNQNVSAIGSLVITEEFLYNKIREVYKRIKNGKTSNREDTSTNC